MKQERLYKIKVRTVKDDFFTNFRYAYINIIDDNWTWEEFMIIDARKVKEFRKYVKSDEFADFVCDMIGPDFKGLNSLEMWNFREEKYKMGIAYFQEFRDKLKQYIW